MVVVYGGGVWWWWCMVVVGGWETSYYLSRIKEIKIPLVSIKVD